MPRLLALCGCWLLAGVGFAAEQTGLAVTGTLPASKLIGITADGGITLEVSGKATAYPPEKLVQWGQFVEPQRGPLVVLADGSWLVAELIGLNADYCRVDSRLLGILALPRSLVRGVIFRWPVERAARDRLIDRLLERTTGPDLLLLANGDELSGQATAHKFDAEKNEDHLLFTATGVKEASALPLTKLTALAFDGALVDAIPTRGKQLLVGLRDGSQLVVTSASERANRVELTLACGWKMRIIQADLSDDIVAWQPLGHGVRYLSDLTTTGYKQIPFLTVAWPYHNDRSDLGGRLRAGGARYSKGLGMHSSSRLAYELDGDYRQFAAEIALDDAAGERGSVIFRVFTNRGDATWQAAYESPVVRGGDAPRSITVDLAGVKRIALIVDFAERGDEQDHADWLNARLLK
ncbi:MAG TPA: NPCBM/NEW2 domain-containing protein [Pirellulaceae bacterium]|nr:NPCBM/NEW2 domain-containing protein [Pirellulaceae bacterium]